MHLEGLIERASRLAAVVGAGQPNAARFLDRLLLFRQESPSALEASLYEPVLCLILQGRKQHSIGEQTVTFGPGECLLVSHADPGLLEALHRYLALADSAADAKVLGPLVAKEIHYRLLMAPFGGMLRNLIRHDSDASAIARAIGHIRADVRSPIAIPELARRVGMSASSFHKHFKVITSTTPLQYQKELRLLEARRLLKTGSASVTTTALEVGYESPSQFSREYARKFGVPPSQDLHEKIIGLGRSTG